MFERKKVRLFWQFELFSARTFLLLPISLFVAKVCFKYSIIWYFQIYHVVSLTFIYVAHSFKCSTQVLARPTFAIRDLVRDSNFLSLSLETKSETEVLRVSISRLSSRLKFSESQFQDRVRDCKFQSLNFETESETQFFKSQFRDRVRD